VSVLLNSTSQPPDTTWGLYTDSGGSPGTLISGSSANYLTIPADYVPTSARWLSLPFGATGLTAGATYWIVVQGTSSTGTFLQWQTTGTAGGNAVAKVSTNGGVSWSSVASTYCLFNVFVGTSGNLINVTEDNPTAAATPVPKHLELAYASGNVAKVYEYCVGQTGGRFATAHTLSYVGGLLSSVALGN